MTAVRAAERLRRGMGHVLVGVIRLYQNGVSPFLAPHCRFQPTCSEYAVEAIRRYGPWRGLWVAMRRIGRCHPFGGHGYDPVD